MNCQEFVYPLRLGQDIVNLAMKICYIADGSSIHTQRWLNYFAGKGHEVHLIYWKVPPGYDKSICIHFLKRFAPQIWPVTRYISFLQWIFEIRKIIKEIKPDILDGHFIIDNCLLAALSGFHPFIVTGWGSDVLIFPQRNFIWRMVVRFVLKRADKIKNWYPRGDSNARHAV
jgi:hypothetical protein